MQADANEYTADVVSGYDRADERRYASTDIPLAMVYRN
jgi:hypothetical protein